MHLLTLLLLQLKIVFALKFCPVPEELVALHSCPALDVTFSVRTCTTLSVDFASRVFNALAIDFVIPSLCSHVCAALGGNVKP